MPSTPSWEGAINGASSNLEAVNHAGQLGQFLGTHFFNTIYKGNSIVSPNGGTQFVWQFLRDNTLDLSQPFTMPGGSTAIGRVVVPMTTFASSEALANSSSVLVSLCPDNGSGSPNTSAPLASTNVSGAWLNELGSALDFVTTGTPQPPATTAGQPLTNQYYNTRYASGGIVSTPWGGPTADASGSVSQNPSVAVSGNFLIMAGGFTTAYITAVNTVQYLGGTTIANAIPQPALPTGTQYGYLATTSNSVVIAGGIVTGSVVTTNTWVAGWNPNTGVIGTWSAQAPLPTGLYLGASASFNNTVYVLGGFNTTTKATVYYANVSNGQLTSWVAGPPLPQATVSATAGVIGNWLIVAGGQSTVNATSSFNNVWYTKINPDGSLGGSWRAGPNLPVGIATFGVGWDTVVTDYTFSTVGGFINNNTSTTTNAIQTLSVSPTDGPADTWVTSQWRESGVEMVAGFAKGDGTYALINTNIPQSTAFATSLISNPIMSIPLPATGLTPGNTYHVVFQAVHKNEDSTAIEIGTADATPLPLPFLVSTRHSGVWTTNSGGASHAILMTVYDQTVGGSILHTWEDPTVTGSTVTSNQAMRTSTFVYNNKKLPIGVLESTTLPNDPMNKNPTFTSGVSSWTPTNATFVQSNAQVHGGFSFSGLFTPNGTAAAPNVNSELIPVVGNLPLFDNGQWFLVNGWLYSPTGYSSVSLSVIWYDSSSTAISTSSNVRSIPAATWTNFFNYFLPPAGTAFASISVVESGTPSSSNTLFLSNVTLALSPEAARVYSPVAQITYGSAVFPPTGIVQLN